MKMKWRNVFKSVIREWIIPILIWALITVGVVYITLKLLDLSKIDQDIPTVFIAIFTFVLACATMYLGVQTAKSNKQSREKEDRDKKERLLNEIIEWSEDMSNIETYFTDLCESVRLDKDRVFSKSCEQLYYEIESIRLKGEYIKIMSESVCPNSKDLIIKLHKHITKITFLLEGFISYQDIVGVDLSIITTENVNGIDNNPDKDTIAKHLIEVDPLCRSIIEEVTRNKILGIS